MVTQGFVDSCAGRANLSAMRMLTASVASLLLLAMPAVAYGQASDGSRFRIVNRTGEVAIGLYASDPGQEGRNLIAGRAMRPGQSAQITRPRPGCLVDVRMVTASGTVFDRREADICATPELVFGTAAPPAASAPAPTGNVAAVQRALGALGYDAGPPDGQMGPRTQAAIAAFQRDRGIAPTGRVDAATIAALRAAGPSQAAQSQDGKPPPAGGSAQAGLGGKPPPASGPDRPQPIPGGRVAALPNPGVAGKPPPAAGSPSAGPTPRRQGALRRASTGTGFVVGEGRLLSNNHVIDGCTQVVGLLPGGRRVPLSVAARDARRDLALLSGPRDVGPVLAFRDGPPRRGDEVVTYGFPLTGILGSGPTLTTGGVSALTGLRDDPNTMILSAPVQSGKSGGPLLDRSGNVLGVIVAKLNAQRVAERTGDLPQNVNIAIQGRVAQEFMRSNGVTPRLAASTTTRAAAEVGEIAHPSTILVECMK